MDPFDGGLLDQQGASTPPPIPPRVRQQPPRFGYGATSGGYYGMNNTGYGHGSYGLYGNGGSYYGGYNSSPYGGGYASYSGYGQPDIMSATSTLIPGARSGFEAIESVVYAASSISMLLDSTYGALLASIRSVFAVVEQVSRMRSHMGNLYAALAFTRFVKWFKDNFGWIVGVKAKPDLIWANSVANADQQQQVGQGRGKPSQWPLMMYMAFLIGAPYLTYKFLQSSQTTSNEEEDKDSNKSWMKGKSCCKMNRQIINILFLGVGDHFVARANFNFHSQDPEELSFKAGDVIKLAPKELQPAGRGWLLASVDGVTSGLVPANRIKVLGRKLAASQPQEQGQAKQSSSNMTNISTRFEDTFEEAFKS